MPSLEDPVFAGPLSNEEKRYIDFIEKHPGCSEQEVVDAFDAGYRNVRKSRVPTMKMIKNLDTYEIITILPNEKNRQTKALFINNESLIFNLNRDMDNVEKSYDAYTGRLSSLVRNKELQPWHFLVERPQELLVVLTKKVLISMLLDWPRKAKGNGPLLNRLRSIALARLATLYDRSNQGVAYSQTMTEALEVELDAEEFNYTLETYVSADPEDNGLKVGKKFKVDKLDSDLVAQLTKFRELAPTYEDSNGEFRMTETEKLAVKSPKKKGKAT